ncbi:hypothetical protein ACEPAF_3582 [Sanghuangporus sanghuang]
MVDRLDAPRRPLPYSHSRTHSHTLAHTLAASDLKLPNTTKGKQKETEDFRFGWWDFVPLFEPRRPPVQWTSSSLILTAHATEPRVACLHFPSNKHFTLPDPPALSASPASYDPPSIICASSRDDEIFAYFPGIDVDGVGCFWSKSRTVDDWTIREWQTFARGDDVVAARWLDPYRKWSSSDSGTPVRLPALGPFIPSLHPVLITVTETRLCDVFYLHPQAEKLHMLSASLARRSVSKETQKRPIGEQVEGPRGLGRCVHAAIGVGYDESSVLVSTYSSFVPGAAPESQRQRSADVNLSLTVPAFEEPEATSNWETWRDEKVIDVCEVNISIEGFFLSLVTTPLPSIRDFPRSGRCLIGMTFVPALPSNTLTMAPSTPTQTHRRVTPQSSPASVPAHVSQSPGRSILRSPVKAAAAKPMLEKVRGRTPSPLYLLCTTLEHGQFAASPSSELILYIFWRNPVDPQTWYFRRMSQLTLTSSVVVHVSHFQPINTPQHTSALLGTLNHEGQPMRRKGEQRVTVGKLHILRLPELQIDDGWEATNLVCPVGSYGVELPFSFAVSPNHSLVCAIPAASLTSFRANVLAFIHRHPSRTMHSGQEYVWQKPKRHLATCAAIALQRRISPGDIIHILCTQSVPISAVEDALATVLLDFETNHAGTTTMWIIEVIGLAIELYRKRSLFARSDAETGDLISRYQAGLEVCSLSACSAVWEETFVTAGYDPDAIWYLTSLCGYFMEVFLENLLKDCVEFASEVSLVESHSDSIDGNKRTEFPNGQTSSVYLSSSLLHLVHPYMLGTLHRFVQHVRRFRGFLGSKMRAEEHLQVAREILIDCVDSSPVDLEALDKVLSEIKSEVKMNAGMVEHSPDIARRALVSLKPPAQYSSLLQKIVSKLMQAKVVDKLALFIKPTDLVDGVLGLSMSSSGKMHDRDIITKGYLTGQNQTLQCLRCDGKSEIGAKMNIAQEHPSIRWTTWERTWQTHCVCGGLWSSRR